MLISHAAAFKGCRLKVVVPPRCLLWKPVLAMEARAVNIPAFAACSSIILVRDLTDLGATKISL